MESLPKTEVVVPEGKELAILAGGCFWCTEALFTQIRGVNKVESGYAGGHLPNPSYEEVCGGRTGHAEAIRITFDPSIVSLSTLLGVFFTTHDPTTLNRQGGDVGPQYRSAIFTYNELQAAVAKEVIAEIESKHVWNNPIVTEVTPFTSFYRAEEYHQDYYSGHGTQPYCRAVIEPKVLKLRKYYQELLHK